MFVALLLVIVASGLVSRTRSLNLALLENDAVAPISRNSAGELNVALSASICRYCVCDMHSATVTCNSERRMRLKVVSLPSWVETFYAHNLSMSEMPRFTYSARLRTIRINFCALTIVGEHALVPLPALETLDLADNALHALPVELLARSTHIKTLNLARNRFEDLANLDLRLPYEEAGKRFRWLDELTLSGNPLRGASRPRRFPWPAAKRLQLDAANLSQLNATHITFDNAQNATVIGINSLRIPRSVIDALEVLDLSENARLCVDASALANFENVSTLSLRYVRALPRELLDLLRVRDTRIRHLDLRGAHFSNGSGSSGESTGRLQIWRNYCGPKLAWLDLSEMALKEVYLDADCGVQWLFADDNQIERVSLQRRAGGVTPLRTLRLRNNRLRSWPLVATDEEANFARNGKTSMISNVNEDINDYHRVNRATEADENKLSANRELPVNRKNLLTIERLTDKRGKLSTNERLNGATASSSDSAALADALALRHLYRFRRKRDAGFKPAQILSRGFDALEIFSLAGNLLEGDLPCSVLESLPALIHLDLSNNRIRSICADRVAAFELNFYDYNADFGFNINALNTLKDTVATETIFAAKLESLNLSGNLLQGLASVPRLDALAVLDASNNQLSEIDFCALLVRLPTLQHLRLANNVRVGNWPVDFNCARKFVRERVAAHLVDINLSNCTLRELPDFSTLPHLSSISVARNALRKVDARCLPACVFALDVSENRVESVENFTDVQLACLRHFDLSRNSLRCVCSTIPYAPVLQQQDEFYDRTEYYCFSLDGWQHPLSAFIDANEDACASASATADVVVYRNVGAIMLASAARTARFLLGVALIGAALCAFALVARRMVRSAAARHRLSPVAYKLIAHSSAGDAPVSL